MSAIRGLAAAGLALGLAAPALAQEPQTPMRRIDFAVSREARVENDRATAVLTVTDEDGDPADLADRVNGVMGWALERARQAEGIEPRSGAYRTTPVTRDGKIQRWRAQQELVLESDDLAALASLVGALQERLELASVGFAVSPERRRAEEDRLIEQALAAYRARADRVREALGADRFELVHLAIETADGGPTPPPRPYEMARMSAEMAPPALESGTSRVQVVVHATIQLD